MYARGYVASNDGNISARLDKSRILTTPKSVSKGFMTPDMMVTVDYEGKKLSGDRDPLASRNPGNKTGNKLRRNPNTPETQKA